MSTTTDLSPERLDELAIGWTDEDEWPFDSDEYDTLIAMARDKQAAERERDALRDAGLCLLSLVTESVVGMPETTIPPHNCGYALGLGCNHHEGYWGAWETLVGRPAQPDSNLDVRNGVPTVRAVDLRHRVFDEVSRERSRQEHLKALGKFRNTCADSEMDDAERSLVLLEEVGEVARAVLEGDIGNVYRELVQVAAVAVAWLESRERAIAGNHSRTKAALAQPTDAGGA